jgi:hypothetical protein
VARRFPIYPIIHPESLLFIVVIYRIIPEAGGCFFFRGGLGRSDVRSHSRSRYSSNLVFFSGRSRGGGSGGSRPVSLGLLGSAFASNE